MNEPKSGSGNGGPSSGGEKKSGGAAVVIVAAVAIGAVVLGGPKLKALFGGKAEVDSAEGGTEAKKKKTRKVKRVVNGEEREVEEEVAADAPEDDSEGPSDPIERAKWAKQREEMKNHRQQALEDYIKQSRFGSETHAMGQEGEGYTGVTKPNMRHESPISLARFSTNPNSKDRPAPYDDKSQKFALLTGSAFNIYPGMPLDAKLTVTQGNPSLNEPGKTLAQPIAVEVVSSRLVKRGADGKISVVADFPINDMGRFGDEAAGDLEYGGVLEAAKVKTLSGDVALNVVFKAPGEKDEFAVSLDWNVISNPHAKITGPTADTLTDDGSLEVLVGVDVAEGGDYFFQGIIEDKAGQQIGWSEARPTLDKGKQSFKFNFYGLLFSEKKVDGPYVMTLAYGTHIYGADRNQTLSVPEWTGKYTTKPYKASQFTAEESKDPARMQRIETLRDLAQRNPGGVTKDGPDFVFDKEGNLVPAHGRAVPSTYPAVDGTDQPPVETNKPYAPDNKPAPSGGSGGSGGTVQDKKP